jgi:transposase
MSSETEALETRKGRNTKKSCYSQLFIAEVVQSVNEGMPQREARSYYQLPKGTLAEWMKQYGTEAWRQRRKLPVAMSVKRKVVRAIEQGQMTAQEAQVAYNIGSVQTVRRWRRELKVENAELVGSNPSVMKDKSHDNKAVNAPVPTDVKALQKALEEAQMKIVALNTLIDVAERQLKINIRKKPGAKQ